MDRGVKLTNKLNLPDAIVRAVTNDSYTPGNSDISVTTLISPPRIRVLRRRHWDELEEDVADRIWALMGQVGHSILERADDAAITERRLYATVAGYRIGGQIDRIEPDTVIDYKFTSRWTAADGIKPEWEAQANIYRYLCRVNGLDAPRGQIVAIYRDWSKLQAARDASYPQQQVEVFDVAAWDHERTERYIMLRLAQHTRAENELPDCTAEERWAKPDTWAVCRTDRKRALRVLDSEGKAHAWACSNDYTLKDGTLKSKVYIEHRPGESTRCQHYCAVAPFCEQWASDPNQP